MTKGLGQRAEWTGFQESRPYGPKYDLRTDFVMVYGISDDLPERIEGWRNAGYKIHLMTGVSWGSIRTTCTVDSTDGSTGMKLKWTAAEIICFMARMFLIWFRPLPSLNIWLLILNGQSTLAQKRFIWKSRNFGRHRVIPMRSSGSG